MSKDSNNMTFFEHLEAFRTHLFRSAVAVTFFGIIAFIFKDFIFDKIIFAPRESSFFTNKVFYYFSQKYNLPELCINKTPIKLINLDLGGQFSMHITVSIFAGIILAFPFIIFEFWKFIRPALKPSERKYSVKLVFFTSILFLFGVLFGYYLIIPLSLDFFGTYEVSSQIENTFNVSTYISTLTMISLSSGIIFELPIIMYFLSKIGMVTPDFLRKYRRHSIVIIFIVAAIITPPDIFSQIMVSIPLIFLYEFSIVISKSVWKRKMVV
jgi:sec-independent protein translocase protein TatC